MQNIINHKAKPIFFLKKPLSQRRNATLYIQLALCFITTISCNKFVDVPAPVNKITTQELFKDDANATTAVSGLYSQMVSFGTQICYGGLTVYTGLASDELNYTNNTAEISEFQNNAISSNNATNQSSFWGPAYKFIYQANACIEGITASKGLSPGVRNQLLGECKVVRSLIYFYLVQLYGDVPLITTSDYNITSLQSRNNAQEVYDLVFSDLSDAKKLLSEAYPSTGKLRPNIYTAKALLARFYLFTENWPQAEQEATDIINSPIYSLQQDLNKVFLAGSSEAIWQLMSIGFGINTREGSTFVNTNANALPDYIISTQLLNAFDPNDPRKSAWIGSKTITNKTYYFPYKYKIPISATAPITEHYMMFRIAEQYLIRAEARIRQGKIDDGVKDLNILRKRARGNTTNILPDLPMGSTQDAAITFLLKERRIELMLEWGNRWFDLKRLHLSNSVLKPIKLTWQDTDTLFPIPSSEILLNKKLTQNNGYN